MRIDCVAAMPRRDWPGAHDVPLVEKRRRVAGIRVLSGGAQPVARSERPVGRFMSP